MKNLLKRTCVLLLVFAMFMSMCSNVFATKLMDGENGKEIYFAWSYYKYDATSGTMVPVQELDSTDNVYFARLSYLNNPSDVTQVMRQFQLVCNANQEIVTNLSTSGISPITDDVKYSFEGNYKDGQLLVAGMTSGGFVQTSMIDDTVTSVTSAALFNVRFKVNRAVNATELKNLFKIAENERLIVRDVNEKLFTIIELPHFAASVKADAETLYTSSTAEKIASNLTGKIISADGTETPVTSGITVELNGDLTPGKNTVTAKYDGYTCDVEIDVKADERDHLEVEGTCNLSYTSGQTLNLTGLTVYEVWKGGNRNVLAPDVYGTEPSRTTPLKVGTHNNQPLKITLGPTLEVTVGNLTVSAADISTAVIGDIT